MLKRIAINAAVDSLRRSRRLEVVHDEESAFHGWSLSESAEDDLRRWAVVNRRIEGSRRALMPFVALLTVIPLGFVLVRRNL